MTPCGNACVDTDTDPQHCGSCAACGPGATGCSGGKCTCDVGLSYCGVTPGCVDLQTDPGHCGHCPLACANVDTCVKGLCTCPNGGLDCNGGVCANTAFDPLHCGMCTTGCDDTRACNNGSCVCRPQLTKISGGCYDTRHDPQHCGPNGVQCQNGMLCGAGTSGTGSCVSPTTCTAFGGKVCNGNGGCFAMAEFASNPLNCGQCGNACKTDEVCIGGTCTHFTVPVDCSAECDGSTSKCCNYPGIPNDTICVQGQSCG